MGHEFIKILPGDFSYLTGIICTHSHKCVDGNNDGLCDVCGGDGYSGTCGENLTWHLTFDGKLSISGVGDMFDFEEYWEEYALAS